MRENKIMRCKATLAKKKKNANFGLAAVVSPSLLSLSSK